MAGLIKDYASVSNQKLITEVERASQELTNRWQVLSNKSVLSQDEISGLENLEGRVQKTAAAAIQALSSGASSSSQSSMRRRLRQEVTRHCDNARRITQEARMKMGPSASAAVVNASPQRAQKASGRNQGREPNLTQILGDWVHAAPDGEQRKEAADRINEFLSTHGATRLYLSNLGLRSLPPVFQLRKEFSTRLELLDLSNNRLMVLPVEIGQLRALQSLYVIINQLRALPAEIGQLQALQSLWVTNNQLVALPAEIGQLRALEHINVCYNQLRALPAEIGQLHALFGLNVSGNQLGALPAEIGQLRALEHINVSGNQLGALPAEIGQLHALQGLNVSGNQLGALPAEIGRLQALRDLYIQNNQLRALPAEIGQLRVLRNLHLAGNTALQSLPSELLGLPRSCTVDLENTGLSSAVLGRLEEAVRAPTYTGPTIHFSMPEARGRVRSMQESLQDLFSTAGREPIPFPELMRDEASSSSLATWLNRLSDTQDYKRMGLRRGLAQKILSYLELAERNPEFRGCFFQVIARATETCGDRVALSILHLGIAYALATADPRDLPRLANLIIKGSWAVDQLENIARAKVSTLRFVDEIEVYLAYPIQLKERLGLQIDIEGMLYLACSGLQEQDFRNAEAFINGQLAVPDAEYNILIRYPEWTQALEAKYPKECETLQATRLKLLEEGVIVTEIQQWYDREMVALTKKALGKSS